MMTPGAVTVMGNRAGTASRVVIRKPLRSRAVMRQRPETRRSLATVTGISTSKWCSGPVTEKSRSDSSLTLGSARNSTRTRYWVPAASPVVSHAKVRPS